MSFPHGATLTPSRGRPLQGEDSDRYSSQHPDREEVLTLASDLGVNRSKSPQAILDGEARDIQNMSYPRDGSILTTRPGLVATMAGTPLPGPVTAVHELLYGTNARVVVATCLNADADDQNLYYYDGSDEPVLLLEDLGSTERPTLLTYGGCLICAVPGTRLREWQPVNIGAAASYADGVVTTTATNPTDGDWLTIGGRVYFWRTTWTQAGEIQIGSGANANAANLVATVNTYSYDVEASANAAVVTITSRRAGAVGNAIPLAVGQATAAAFSVSGTTGGKLDGGVDGLAIDEIDTTGAPTTCSRVALGCYADLVADGDSTYVDRTYFCAPNDAWQWATPTAGGNGATWDVGNRDGTRIVALASYLSEILVHKGGQGKRIKRINVPDADPANWSAEDRGYIQGSVAVNQRCAQSLAGKHFFLDRHGFFVLEGTDSYDEISSHAVGQKVYDLLASASPAAAFMVFDPDNLHLLIFSDMGKGCLVFHYGSGRWTRYQFPLGARNIVSGCYDSANERLMFGLSDGTIAHFDDSESTDLGASFSSVWTTRTVGANTFQNKLFKRGLLDWRNKIAGIAGSGKIEIVPDNDTSRAETLGTFTVTDDVWYLYDARNTSLYAARNIYFTTEGTGRAMLCEYGPPVGLLALRITLTSGAFAINHLALLVGHEGVAEE